MYSPLPNYLKNPNKESDYDKDFDMTLLKSIHTYIIGHYTTLQSLRHSDYGLASHTTYVVCVNFVHEWRDLQFNVDSE